VEAIALHRRDNRKARKSQTNTDEKIKKAKWSERDERHRTRAIGNGAFGESDIEGKAAVGSGE